MHKNGVFTMLDKANKTSRSKDFHSILKELLPTLATMTTTLTSSNRLLSFLMGDSLYVISRDLGTLQYNLEVTPLHIWCFATIFHIYFLSKPVWGVSLLPTIIRRGAK